MTRRPRLGVDGRELRPGVRTGIRRYLAEVLRAASRAGWSCVVYGDASTVVDEALPGVATRVLPGRCTQVWDQVRLPRALREDGATVFLSPYYHIEARFFVPVLPFLLPFVAAGALWVAGALVAERRAGAVALGLTLVVGLAALPGALRPVLRPDPGAGLYPEAARWVAATQPVGAAGRRRAETMFGQAGHDVAVERVYREVIRAS